MKNFEEVMLFRREFQATLSNLLPTKDDLVNKVKEELSELLEAIDECDDDHVEDEAGDLIMSVLALLQGINVDPEIALLRGADKVKRRLSVIIDGKTWEEAKKIHPN